MVDIAAILPQQTDSPLYLGTGGTYTYSFLLKLGESVCLSLHNNMCVNMMVGRNDICHFWGEAFNCQYSTLLFTVHPAKVIVKEYVLIKVFKSWKLHEHGYS